MRGTRAVIAGMILGLMGAHPCTTRAASLSLTQEGVVFPDGTVQTTAATNEVAGFFQAGATVNLPSGFVGSYGTAVVDVPDGYRAIVEFVSASCSVPTGAIITSGLALTRRTGPSSAQALGFQVPMAYHGTFGGSRIYVGSLATRLYADSGLGIVGITAFATRESGTGDGSCSVSINGRFLPLPPSEVVASQAAKSAPTEEIVVPFTPGPPPPDVLNPPEGAIINMLGPSSE